MMISVVILESIAIYKALELKKTIHPPIINIPAVQPISQTHQLDQKIRNVILVVQSLTALVKEQQAKLEKLSALDSHEVISEQLTNPAMPVVTVSVIKANLRTGPGKEYPTLMAVTGGTRLVLLSNQKGWQKILAPSGEEAWIHGSLAQES